MSDNQITEKSWDEFKNTKLLWWINRTLHLFGWAIVLELDEGKVKRVYPARVNYRGFSEETESRNFIELSEYLKNNITEVHDTITKH